MEKNTLIDFHAHILPGMDHGCRDVGMSIAQLKMAAEQNIDLVIATSHFYPHSESVGGFLVRRNDAWMNLLAARGNGQPSIRLGAEVLLCKNIDQMAGIEELCIENTKVLLLEMPYLRQWEPDLIETMKRLKEKNGLDIILAHSERYPAKELKKLLDIGLQVQLNVSSMKGLFSSRRAEMCIKRNCVAALGTDMHGLHNSYKDFTRAMKKYGTKALRIMEQTQKLLEENEVETAKFLQNNSLPVSHCL